MRSCFSILHSWMLQRISWKMRVKDVLFNPLEKKNRSRVKIKIGKSMRMWPAVMSSHFDNKIAMSHFVCRKRERDKKKYDFMHYLRAFCALSCYRAFITAFFTSNPITCFDALNFKLCRPKMEHFLMSLFSKGLSQEHLHN